MVSLIPRPHVIFHMGPGCLGTRLMGGDIYDKNWEEVVQREKKLV